MSSNPLSRVLLQTAVSHNLKHVRCEIRGKDARPFLLCVVYRPPCNPEKDLSLADFLIEWADFLDLIDDYIGDLVIVGDLNVKLDLTNKATTREFISLLNSHNLTQHVDCPTHIHGHTLDVVITRDSGLLSGPPEVYSSGIGDGHGHALLDHYAVQIRLSIPHKRSNFKTVSYRQVTDFPLQEFKQDLQTSKIHGDIDPSEAVDTYNSVLRSIFDKHAPVITKKITSRRQARWYTPEIRESKRACRRAERKMRKRKPCLQDDVDSFDAISKQSNQLIHSAKEAYYTDAVKSATGNQKEVFRVSKSLLGLKQEVTYPDNVPRDQLCDKFSDFFQDKIIKIRDKIESDGCSISDTLRRAIEPAFVGNKMDSFLQLSTDEVSKLINAAQSKSCESDPIPTWLLKQCLDDLLPTITSIVNHSLQTGSFHDSFKRALIRPLLKKPGLDCNSLQNYRPVSNLPFISKIIEKAVSAQLHKHLDQHDLLDKYQSAYRKGHSTETALLRVQNDVTLALDKGHSVVLIMLDLSAAFDTIDHQSLLKRLEHHYGLSGVVLDWTRSYLRDRKLVVRIDANESGEKTVDYSVPQGAILGAEFYCLFAKPATAIIRYHNMEYHIYADDSQLYIIIKKKDNLSDTVQRIESCVSDIHGWMSENKLKLNEGKTEIIFFSSKSKINLYSNLTFNLGGNVIAPVSSVKNLGVYLDNTLSMEPHILSIERSCHLHLREIRRIRKFLTTDTCKTIVQALITSKLDYCNSLMHNLPGTTIGRLQKLQNSAARVICGTPMRDHITPVLRELHWLPVTTRIEYKIILLTYKALHGLAPSYLSDLLVSYTQRRVLRPRAISSKLVTPRCELKKYSRRSFSVAGPTLWNTLPDSLHMLDSVAKFKGALKTFLFKKCFNC